MSVQVILYEGHKVFTNLDVISGKVILSLGREETFTSVTVKLECESRTRLAAPSNRNDRYDNEFELHKLLYKTLTVFPTPQLQQLGQGRAAYTLPAGRHEWPFQFKIPFNNMCGLSGGMMVANDYLRHVKRALPPSLSGFPGEAEIRYFAKATAQRAAFYKENFRHEVTFKFFPIEPPRPPPNSRQSYARVTHQFAPPADRRSSQTMFRKPSASSNGLPPSISVDGRLPDPAIITCNEPLPLRVLVRKLNDTRECIFLSMFQLVLVGFTKVNARQLSRTETNSWVIASHANLNTPLSSPDTPANKDLEINPQFWNEHALVNTICPTFETCNLSRRYELEISVGLMYGSDGDLKPELTVQRICMPCQIFSGIKPPNELVEDALKRQSQLPTPSKMPQATSPSSTSMQPAPQPPSSTNDIPDEPPPSYEDAMAEDLAPVDGPRMNYEQPQSGPVVGDEKRGSIFGR